MNIKEIHNLNLGGFPSIIKIDNFINKKREFEKLNKPSIELVNLLSINDIFEK
jgi:hypothetical protein